MNHTYWEQVSPPVDINFFSDYCIEYSVFKDFMLRFWKSHTEESKNTVSNTFIQERQKRESYIDQCRLETPLEVANLFMEYTKVIWNHKMVGRIYDIYCDDCVIHREGGVDIRGIQSVFAGTLAFMASFPDLEFVFIDIFSEGNPEEGYRFGQAIYYEGTNTGYSSFGPPSGKQLTEEIPCIALCECLVKQVNGRWKIVEEWLVRSNMAIEETLTAGDNDEF